MLLRLSRLSCTFRPTCAGERKDTVRIRSRLHRELDDIINESGDRQQLVRDGAGIGKERSLLFLLFDPVRLQDSAQIHIGVRLLPAVVASGFAKFTQGAPVVAGTAVVMAFECHRPGRFLNQHGGLVGVRLIERADAFHGCGEPSSGQYCAIQESRSNAGIVCFHSSSGPSV